MKLRGLLLSIAIGLAGCDGCDAAIHPRDTMAEKIGSRCTVTFRRDVLGVAGSHPISPTSNGSDVAIEGTLTGLDGDYVIVRDKESRVVWIHGTAILLVRFDADE